MPLGHYTPLSSQSWLLFDRHSATIWLIATTQPLFSHCLAIIRPIVVVRPPFGQSSLFSHCPAIDWPPLGHCRPLSGQSLPLFGYCRPLLGQLPLSNHWPLLCGRCRPLFEHRSLLFWPPLSHCSAATQPLSGQLLPSEVSLKDIFSSFMESIAASLRY